MTGEPTTHMLLSCAVGWLAPHKELTIKFSVTVTHERTHTNNEIVKCCGNMAVERLGNRIISSISSHQQHLSNLSHMKAKRKVLSPKPNFKR